MQLTSNFVGIEPLGEIERWSKQDKIRKNIQYPLIVIVYNKSSLPKEGEKRAKKARSVVVPTPYADVRFDGMEHYYIRLHYIAILIKLQKDLVLLIFSLHK